MRSGIVSLILAFSCAVNAMPTILTSPDHRSGTHVMSRDQGQEIIWYFLIPDGAKFVNDNHVGAQTAAESIMGALLSYNGTPRRKIGTADFVGDPDHFNFNIESSAKIDFVDCPCKGRLDLDRTTGEGEMRLNGKNTRGYKRLDFTFKLVNTRVG
ncbi:hypothetical protein GGU10DRAFT_409023 [Lentinula aff. detonsa]|uniref:Uncharacterized protein n=1 Tax=Lentinula aff. detonsa TaxID=2804958 RepID=A0AA38KYC4_9AGAR|nr:hypothetical protein GGU10DRAFT_409023 [Lentinula aff. detonsa]